jgi:hypothetical protein
MLLGSHPQACTVGEIRAPSMGQPDLYQCSCGEKIKQCPFWDKVRAGMASRGIADFDITQAATSIFEVPDSFAQRLLEPLHRGPFLEAARDGALSFSAAWRNYLREVRRRNLALVQVLHELAGARIIIDSSKSALHLKYLLRTPGFRIKVLQLMRDGRAVTASIIGHGRQRATRAETISTAAREWRRSNEAAESLVKRLPSSQVLSMRYEDLCREPEAELRRACTFLEIDPSLVSLDFRARQLHVLGNDMRLKSTAEITLDERWRTQLSAEDLNVFEKVAGEMNRAYGYS